MKRDFIVGCHIVAAICFGLVSVLRFFDGEMGAGLLFAALAAAQATMAAANFTLSRKYGYEE